MDRQNEDLTVNGTAGDGCLTVSLQDRITPQMLTLVDLNQQQIDDIVQAVPGGAKNVQDIYPLTPLQEGMLFHHLLDKQNDTYVLSTLLELDSQTHLDALIKALQTVIDRHDILRSAMRWEHLPRPVQVVHHRALLPVAELMLAQGRDTIEQLKERMLPRWQQEWNLQQAPLLRLRLARELSGPTRYALLQLHHLVCDHQSLGVVLSEVMACIAGDEGDLPSPMAYRNHVANVLSRIRPQEAEAFFSAKLASIDEPTAPFGLFDVHGDGNRIEESRGRIEPDLAKRIRIRARRIGLGPARLFHAAWGLVVARTSGRDDVVYGTVLSSGRHVDAQGRRVFGMSVNTLPLRLRFHGVTAKEIVEQTHQELADLLSHEDTPLALAQRCSGVGSAAPLFTALLNYRHSARSLGAEETSIPGIRVLARGEAWSSYPVALTVDDVEGQFELTAHTDRRIAANRVVEYLKTAMQSLVEALETEPQTPALSLPILPEGERRQVIKLFNATRTDYPRNRQLIHELFEAQVTRTPDTVAVEYEGRSFTFAELSARGNQLARYLRYKGVGPDQLVGLCVERSLEMIVGVLGILKAGGAYVPLDPNYPADRLAHMLEDAAPTMLLTQGRLKERLKKSNWDALALDEDWSVIAKEATRDFDANAPSTRSHHLAYVIYTSGSTGEPKGVMVEHANVLNLWQGLEKCIYTNHSECRRVGLNSGLGFDASVKQIVQLLSGRSLVIIPQSVRQDPSALLRFVTHHRIDVLDCTPSQLAALVHAGLLREKRQARGVVLVGGEGIPVPLWKTLAQSSEIDFYNVYGPTECTVDATAAHVNGMSDAPCIGRPVANVQIYILDNQGQPVPIDVTGEIYIGGAGVARGYRNRPDLTAERFIQDPFSDNSQSRMYRTGDVGRWRSSGIIECLGRTDFQVKVRGFRIELGEIEALLLRHSWVSKAVVIAREEIPDEKRLVAYVVPRDPTLDAATPDVDTLRAHLKATLPEYMVPSAFVVLERLPLTPNGKLDRRALPAPELSAYVSRTYEAPQGAAEELLAGIWRELLQVTRIGRRDNFFELGGHSLLIVKMLDQLHRVGWSVEIRQVFESPALADLAGALTAEWTERFEVPPNRIPAGCEAITPEMLPLVELEAEHIERIAQAVPGGAANIQDIYPLTPLQEGMLFHHLFDTERVDVYVELMLLSLSSRERVEAFIDALQKVIDRHDILRTAVLWEQLPRPVQVVYRQAALPVKEITLNWDHNPMKPLDEWTRPGRRRLDLRQAPLIRLEIAADPDSSRWYTLLEFHHLLSDHESRELLLSEVTAYLEGSADGLPEPVAYRNHVAQALEPALAHDAETFFLGKLGDIDEPTAPFGLLDVHTDASRVDQAQQPLPASLAARIRSQARRMGVSAATFFHAAWAVVVARTSAQDDVVFGTVLLGRLQGSAGAQRTLGMFINTLPLRLRLQNVTVKELVEQTQRELVELLTHEQASLAVAQRCSGIPPSLPLFTSLFNYRHNAVNFDDSFSRVAGVAVLEQRALANFPLTVSVDSKGEGFLLTVDTDHRVDARRVMDYVHTAVTSLLDALERTPQTSALSLSILPASERVQIVEGFTATARPYPHDKLIHEVFEEHVRRTPQAIAVMDEEHELTYSELNAQANRLAKYLTAQGLRAGEYFPILMARGIQMLIAQLAVLKGGGAYVPIDPKLPAARQLFIIRDCGARRVLTDQEVHSDLNQQSIQWIEHRDAERAAGAYSPQDAQVPIDPLSPAYVMYTSGSTGIPKGVIVPHRAVNRLVINNGYVDIGPADRLAHCSNPAFDASTFEIWGALLNAARTVVVPESTVLEPELFSEVLKRRGITVLWLTFGLFAQYAESLASVFAQLRCLLIGGEVVEPRVVRSVLRDSPPGQLLNAYGPTECTTFSTTYPIEMVEDDTKSIPIGRPISNTRIYILDKSLQPVPIGVTGEIHIGGAGLALGYLNRPELTAERFITNPFSTEPGMRLYKTGDLGRWRADGVVEYVGRNDQQVKIRGHRIELGEIEARLLEHSQVKEAVVLAREDEPGDRRLAAYVVADWSTPKAQHAAVGPDADADEFVEQWRALYEQTYSTGDTAPSFVGWNSSYTGQPIAEDQMREWRQTTVERINALRPRKVLEIGCGVGLLLEKIAPDCEAYRGTDFSAEALTRLRSWLSTRPNLQHVVLDQCSALEMEESELDGYDTVILNSIVQYFPNIEYLQEVLKRLANRLSEGGRIFIGDIRHLGLLKAFHSSVQFEKASLEVTVGQLKVRVARAIEQEKELVIDPRFFAELRQRLPAVTGVQVLLKRGLSDNELTRYRYDVILEIGGSARLSPGERMDWKSGSDIAELLVRLRERRPSRMRICGVRNRRLHRDIACAKFIEESDESNTVERIRERLHVLEIEGELPETFWKLGDACGYQVRVDCELGYEDGSFDVDFIDASRTVTEEPDPDNANRALDETGRQKRKKEKYANDPVGTSLELQLIPKLREYLKDRLPEYMVPTAFVVLESLPLTPNGKLDRRALQAPEGKVYSSRRYESPEGPIEEVLAGIWQELLWIERVGRKDSFFELGGHSLLVLRVVSKINRHFGSALTVLDVYKGPTICEVAARISGTTLRDELVDLSREAMLDTEITALPRPRPAVPQALLLTGATGFVGRFLAAQLLNETAATLYCLMRARSPQQALSRLKANMSKWNLWRDDFEQRVVAVPGDLRQPHLGMDEMTYETLCQRIDSVFHCGTSMNHLETYATAKLANVNSARELLKFATRKKPKLVNYISTLGVFRPLGPNTSCIVDEASPIEDEKHWASRGYVASKWVAEKIFMTAGQRGIPCNIFRLGLVWADTQQGRYDELQTGYRVLRSCLLSHFGIRDFRYDYVPTPVDYVARAVVHLSDRFSEGQGIFHISSTEQKLDGVFECWNEMTDNSLKLLSYYDWLCEVKRLHNQGRTLPIVPLVELYFSMDERSFHEHQRRFSSGTVHFDCTLTHRELERVGIVAPVVNRALLRRCMESMLYRDPQFRSQ